MTSKQQNPSTGETDHELRARARAAVARVRLRRSIERKDSMRNWLDLGLWCVIGALVLGACIYGGYRLVQSQGGDVFKDHPALIAIGMTLTLGWFTLLLVVLALAIPLAFLGISQPFRTVGSRIRKLRKRCRIRRYLQTLEEEGKVVLGPGFHRDNVVLRDMARDDHELVYDKVDNSLRAKPTGPPESCPRCRANLENPEPGIRRCGHCEFERFDELGGLSQDLSKARELIGAVAEGTDFTGSRSELWKRFKQGHTNEEASMAPGMAIGALVFGGIGEIGVAKGIDFLAGAGRLGAFFLGFGAGLMLPIAVYRAYALRYREFRPGARAYDVALADDIITTLAQQGRMKTDALAAHLQISRKHLERVLGSLAAFGKAPVYSDGANDMLISLHAMKIDDTACPACGGLLEVAKAARLQCQHCGAKSLAA